VDHPGLGTLTDDQLILLVDSLADCGDELFDAAFDELARRIREEEVRDGRADVEAKIAHLRSVFTSRGGEDGPDTVGVREPRRPSPSAGSEAVALDAPDGYEEAA
jgi:hypothetical protein